MQFLVAMTFFLALMITTVMPAIELIAQTVLPIMSSSGDGAAGSLAISGVIDTTLTAVFVGMPLMLLGGIVLVVFIVGTGLRGTSR